MQLDDLRDQIMKADFSGFCHCWMGCSRTFYKDQAIFGLKIAEAKIPSSHRPQSEKIAEIYSLISYSQEFEFSCYKLSLTVIFYYYWMAIQFRVPSTMIKLIVIEV